MPEVKTITPAEKAVVRKDIYAIVESALATAGYATEPIDKGLVAELADGNFVGVQVVYKDPGKFDIDVAREEYLAKVEAAEARAAAKADKAAKRAVKEAEKKAAKEAKAAE